VVRGSLASRKIATERERVAIIMAEYEFEVRGTSEAMKFPRFRIIEISFGSLYPPPSNTHSTSFPSRWRYQPFSFYASATYLIESTFSLPSPLPSPSQARRSHSPPDPLLPLPSTNFPLVHWPIGVAGDIKHALVEFSDRSAFVASHNGAPSFAMRALDAPTPVTHSTESLAIEYIFRRNKCRSRV